MNTPNPLVPQGSVLEQQSKGRSRIRLALFIVVAAHVVFLGPLLIQGCKPESKTGGGGTNASYLPPLESSNLVDIASTAAPSTSAYVPPTTTNTGALPPANMVDNSATSAGTFAGVTSTHKIAPNDTLGGLAKHYHVLLKDLLAANPSVNPTRLKIGETIMIPAPTVATAATGTALTTFAPTTTGDTTSYKVKAGDTLIKIASAHGTSVKAIQSVNGLKTTTIQVGKTLKIPSRASAPAPATEAGASAAIVPTTSPTASLTSVPVTSAR